MLIHPEALAELNDAAAFYSERANKARGVALVSEVEHALSSLFSNPALGAIWRGSPRRLPLQRFPFSLEYQINPHEIRIIALAHQRRRPGYWRGRK